MSIFLIEIKNEYTSRLLNILAPHIFDGMQSIYNDSAKLSHEKDVLKVFQTCLKAIPKWSDSIIAKETFRILKETNSVDWLEDLIKATIKSYVLVLTYDPINNKQKPINSTDYENITTSQFIHTVYIETARELWNSPYLLFHKCTPIELKKNQRDCLGLIKDCIKEALRKLLPYKQILNLYLCNSKIEDLNIDNNLTEQEINNIKKMCSTDLNNNQTGPQENALQTGTLQTGTLQTGTLQTGPQENALQTRPTNGQMLPPQQQNTLDQQQSTVDQTQGTLTQQGTLTGGYDTPKPAESETVRSRILNIINNGGGTTIENKYKIDDKIRDALHILSSNIDSETSLMSENVLDVFINSAHNNKKNTGNNYMTL
jgi:cell wall-associated NlpC family hydrolase